MRRVQQIPLRIYIRCTLTGTGSQREQNISATETRTKVASGGSFVNIKPRVVSEPATEYLWCNLLNSKQKYIHSILNK